ncbi:MAG: hypothetical protein QN152_12065 [Armatimonadota bacterium]|nr:hypothetical protein [Armatimonadota bacterium]MDR7465460.1 hypothetical protein [Armatimonadota bacterium]MDR7469544.1 hypothetical protein [Armatimonadota bacterium]MDR7473448.1 hypothetical protein [Armatimonadota bacterium]MDR7540243.1 hypothetical protein [Armatimonadota bacterium]
MLSRQIVDPAVRLARCGHPRRYVARACPGWWLVLLLPALVVSPAAPAAPAVVTVARDVSPQATAENSQRKLVIDRQGRVALAFVRPVGGTDRVFLAESEDRGRSWRWAEVPAASRPARLPALHFFPDGALHLVWTDFGLKGRILYTVRRAGRWRAPLALSPPGVYAGVPVVAPLRGLAHVLWYGIRPERPQEATRHGAIYQILATRQQGRAWVPPEVISPGIPDSINPALGADAAGRLHAAWFQFDGRVYQVRYTRFTGRWEAPRSITAGEVDHTNVALDADGVQAHLIWEERGPQRTIVYGLPGRPSQTLASGAVGGPVVAAAGGRVAAAWSEGGMIVVRSIRPAAEARRVAQGIAPVLALRGSTAYLAWTWPGPTPEVRFAAILLP